LLNEINKQAAKNNRTQDVLIQLHIAEESSKFGFSYQEADELLKQELSLTHVRIKGLMGMASFTEDRMQIKREFAQLATFFNKWKASKSFEVLSMGMSGDYPLAIEAGSNMIRVGSLIFGSRT
jgi:pyridoxal phosphate enzyme (YggS family)